MGDAATRDTLSPGRLIAEILSLSVIFLLVAGLLAIPFALGSPPELSPTTGENLAWWTKAAQLYLSWLPWLVLVVVAYLAPVTRGVAIKLRVPIVLLVSIPIGMVPGLVLLLLGAVLPVARGAVVLSFPVTALGIPVSMIGCGVWLLVRRHHSR